MRSNSVALAAELRESRPAGELSGFEMCLLAGGTKQDSGKSNYCQRLGGHFRICREHLGLTLLAELGAQHV
jgi:hypothetical protein